MGLKRLLFLAEGATMQHFVRPLALADAVDLSRYEVHLYAPRRFQSFLADKPYACGELATIDESEFLRNLSRGAPLFSPSDLREYVDAERRLIARLKPDLVIGDLRFSLPISARLEQVKSAVIMNAYWSPFAKRRSVIPELPITRLIPPRWLGGVFRAVEPWALGLHVRGINAVRREHGFPVLRPDPRQMYTDGDYVLYPDLPQLIPTKGAPASHHYVGPCPWDLPSQKPAWWEEMLADPLPKVFVTLGSSGPVRILPRLLDVLAGMPVAVILTTSGRVTVRPPSGVYAAPLLPFREAAAASALVISHGGSSSFYPALAASTPVLGIPSNADQQIATEVLVESGAGLGIRVEEASVAKLQRAIEEILAGARYKQAATHWQAISESVKTTTLFGQFLTECLG